MAGGAVTERTRAILEPPPASFLEAVAKARAHAEREGKPVDSTGMSEYWSPPPIVFTRPLSKL